VRLDQRIAEEVEFLPEILNEGSPKVCQVENRQLTRNLASSDG
jgi:hypothetical protein